MLQWWIGSAGMTGIDRVVAPLNRKGELSMEGRVVWVTGASSGIGRALSEEFAARGASVILSGRREDALADVRAGLLGDALILPFEVSDHSELPRLVADAVGWRARVDVLVNNAGISHRSLAVDTAPALYERVIDVDLVSPILLTQALLHHLIAEPGRHIVNISSTAGLVGWPLRTAYCAAKHGLIGYGDALRAETQIMYGLGVLNMCPGSVRTDVARNALDSAGNRRGLSDNEIDGGLEPRECAKAIVDAMLAGEPEVVLADGPEFALAHARHRDSLTVFAATAAIGAELAARSEGL